MSQTECRAYSVRPSKLQGLGLDLGFRFYCLSQNLEPTPPQVTMTAT